MNTIQFIPEESKQTIRQSSELLIETMSQNLDESAEYKRILSITKEFIRERSNTTNEFLAFINESENIMDYGMLISYLYLDIATLVRANTSATSRYEHLFSAKQILVVLSEGYKKIYGFNNEIRNSFWIKNIGAIIEQYPTVKNEYDLITNCLDKIKPDDEDKIIRDLATHYDKEPIKVYNMLTSLDVDKIFKKAIFFTDMLNRMYTFLSLLLKLKNERSKANNPLNQFVKFWNEMKNQYPELDSDPFVKKAEEIRDSFYNAPQQ